MTQNLTAETPYQKKARLFISYKMAQQELQRALECILDGGSLERAETYGKSAADVIIGKLFDLENTTHGE